MFNDLTLSVGLIWGKAIIDTVKEQVYLSNLSRGAIKEIETVLTKYMIQKKRQLEVDISDVGGKKQTNSHHYLKEI